MRMLNVLAEGYSEKNFVEKMLGRYLDPRNRMIFSRCVTTSIDRRKGKIHRGGISSYVKVKNDLQKWLKECPGSDVRFSTMFDYYALPVDFPGFNEANQKNDVYEKVKILEEAFATDIGDWRFIPYIQLHEFESLIFVDPQALDFTYIDKEDSISNLVEIAQEFGNPELINNGPETAPSKRILKEIPEYDKVVAGVDTLELIGVDLLKQSCKHFCEWIIKLENVFRDA